LKYFSPAFGEGKIHLGETQKEISGFGGIAPFVHWLKEVGFEGALRRWQPVTVSSHNALDPAGLMLTFIAGTLLGCRHFSHFMHLRWDALLLRMLGLKQAPTDDTMMNYFRKFTMENIAPCYNGLFRWCLEKGGDSADVLDLDSTILERCGSQEGSLKGYNPRRKGRPSHHPLVAFLANRLCFANLWLRGGNAGAANNASQFLVETLGNIPVKISLVRADSGFMCDHFLSTLEEKSLPYIVVARATATVKNKALALTQWSKVPGSSFESSEFQHKAKGWNRSRRIVVLRLPQNKEDKKAAGHQFPESQGWTYRFYCVSEAIKANQAWQMYKGRANIENHIGEIKSDLAMGGFCLDDFYATEAALRAIAIAHNLLAMFQRDCGHLHQRPATIRDSLFRCGAVLASCGRGFKLLLPQSWGGLKRFKSLLQQILSWSKSTSPKLDISPIQKEALKC
jgi:Transposase DDE domain group 1